VIERNIFTRSLGNEFSVEEFLSSAKIHDKDIESYSEFLKKYGLKQEKQLKLLTAKVLENYYEKTCKTTNRDFSYVQMYVDQIVATASSWRKG
jgi:hypothetical protein